jgi:hypothetical protein
MIKNLVISVLLIIVILFLISAPSYNKSEMIVKTDTVFQQKTFTKYIKGNTIPFVVLDTTFLIDQVHDTITIVKDYLNAKVYSDSIRIDSQLSVFIHDTIAQNKIQGRSVTANMQQKTIYVTNTIRPKDKTALYLGFLADMRQDNKQIGIGIGMAIKTSNKGVITLNASTNNYSIGYYLKF